MKELDNKMDVIIKQLGFFQGLQLNLSEALMNFLSLTAHWIEERREEAGEEEKKLQIVLNYQGLLLGLFIG